MLKPSHLKDADNDPRDSSTEEQGKSISLVYRYKYPIKHWQLTKSIVELFYMQEGMLKAANEILQEKVSIIDWHGTVNLHHVKIEDTDLVPCHVS